MPHQFTEWEEEPEPQASASHAGSPPRKITGVGIFDPPVPPKRQEPLYPIAGSLFVQIVAVVILIGIVVATFLWFYPR